jgi:hypothetical protein
MLAPRGAGAKPIRQILHTRSARQIWVGTAPEKSALKPRWANLSNFPPNAINSEFADTERLLRSSSDRGNSCQQIR